MTIKFPDFQVLVSRSDQIPRVNQREGDQAGAAGKMAPQVVEEFAQRQERVQENEAKDKVRRRQEREGSGNRGKQDERKQQDKRKGQIRGRRIDLRA